MVVNAIIVSICCRVFEIILKGYNDMNFKEMKLKIDTLDVDDTAKAMMKEQVYFYEQAELAHNEKRFEDEIKILEMLLERMPEDLNAKSMLAVAYHSAGHPRKSIRQFEDLYEIDQYCEEYSMALAMGYYHQGWMQKALRQLKKTVDLVPESRVAWEYLVECSIDIEDRHESKMNCFGAIYVLKEFGIESIRLNAFAFSFTILENNDKADMYLANIIDKIQNGEKYNIRYYQKVIFYLLEEIEFEQCYEFMPRIRAMVDLLPDISDELNDLICGSELNADISVLEETFPATICEIIHMMIKGCNCDNCENNLASAECSVLTDYEGYLPELVRLSNEHPKLYALHRKFFDEAIVPDNRDRLLRSRLKRLSKEGLEPLLVRADGSEINPNVETYRREGRKIGRNESCPCGSNKKYKKCCGA
jgi:tetratricopeptide (TPR) repeat protein